MLGPMGNLQMCDIYSYLWVLAIELEEAKTHAWMTNVTEEMGFVKLDCRGSEFFSLVPFLFSGTEL